MCNSEKKDIWLAVVNVFAASRKAGSVWKKAAGMLNDHGVNYKTMFTGEGDNAIEISRKASAMGYRKFIAVGGDGTVHDVLNGIMSYITESGSSSSVISEFTIGVLPVGSGNDWVKSTGVPRDIGEAVCAIAEGCTVPQDVVSVSMMDSSDQDAVPQSVTYMVNVGGVGLDARVCEIVNRQKEQGKRGKKLYVSALLYCISNRVPITARVVCDGQAIFDGKYLSIAFGVGKYSGGGMRQTPLAELGDGLLDVTVIPDVSIWTIAREVPKLFTGTFHTVDVLTVARCKEVLVIPASEADAEPVEVDGEVVGRAPVRLTVLPERVNVLTKGRR